MTNQQRIEHLEAHISILDEALRLLIASEKLKLAPYQSNRWSDLDTIENYVAGSLDNLNAN